MKEDFNKSKSQLIDELQQLRSENSTLKSVQTLFYAGPVVVFKWCNSSEWPVEYVSPNVKDVFGYTVDDFYTKKVLYANIIIKSDLDRIELEIEKAIASGKPSLSHQPYQIKHKDGSVRWLSDYTVIVKNKHNETKHFYGYVFDITERIITEQELLLTRNQYEEAQRFSGLASWSFNITDKYLYWSPEVYKILDIDPRQHPASYKVFLDRVHPDDRNKVDLVYKESVSKSLSYDFTYRLLMPDGSIKYIRERGKTFYDDNSVSIRSMGSVQDISQYKETEILLEKFCNDLQITLGERNNSLLDLGNIMQAGIQQRMEIENALREERDFINNLIDTAQVIILVIDLNGKIIRTNSYFESLSGYVSDEVMGKDGVETFLFAKDHAEARAILNRLTYGESMGNVIFPLVTKCAENVQVSWNGKSLKDDQGDINGVLFIGHNITERLQIEQALYNSKADYQLLFEDSPVPLWEEDFTELFKYLDELKVRGVKDFRLFFDGNMEELRICAGKIKILNVNQAAIKFHAAKNKEDLLANLEKVFTEKTYQVFKEEVIAFASGKLEFESEAEVKTLSGELRYNTLKIKIEKNKQGSIKALFATLDITKRKLAEESLVRHRNILACVAEISKNFLISNSWQILINRVLLLLGEATCVSRAYLFEVHSGSNERLLCSQRFEWCADGIEPQINNKEFQNVDWGEAGLEKWYEVLASNKVLMCRLSECTPVEHYILDSQNVLSMLIVPLFVNKQPWGFIGFDDCENERHWSDVEIASLESAAGVISGAIEREHSKHALRESEQRFRGLVESTNDRVWEVDDNNIYTYVSPSVEKILGYLPEELYGKTPFELMSAEEVERISPVYMDIVKKQIPFTGLENINIHKEGFAVTLETNGVPIFNQFGEYTGYRGIDRDISDRRQAEKIRLEMAEKQRDELVREVHHRIKNHLQGLMGLLKQREKDGRKYDVIIDETIVQIESIAIVYGLQASHPDAQIYFGQMLEAIMHSAAGLTQVSLINTHGEKSGSCEIDRNKAVALALVINELIINAIKYYSSNDNDYGIKIHHEHESSCVKLTISNPGKLPDKFDFLAGKSLGTGLELVKAMLPRKGAKLNIFEKNDEVVAILVISSPLLIDI